jgi:hypothetical protein
MMASLSNRFFSTMSNDVILSFTIIDLTTRFTMMGNMPQDNGGRLPGGATPRECVLSRVDVRALALSEPAAGCWRIRAGAHSRVTGTWNGTSNHDEHDAFSSRILFLVCYTRDCDKNANPSKKVN